MILKKILFFLLFWAGTSISQEKIWFPGELNVQPFTSNILEARTGFSYLLGQSSIRLDIGTSLDFYHHKTENSNLSFGADFFTYTRLHGSGEFHFPVETIDYLFGINAGYKISGNNSEYGFRIRLSHISAHLVDGSYDYVIDDWRNYNRPRVYSREFIELIPYYRFSGLRFYSGLTYLFHTSPAGFGRAVFQAGFDYYFLSLHDAFTPFAAYDFKLSRIEKYSGNNIISAGVKFGRYDKKGFSLIYSYYSGKSIHGEFFDISESYSIIGFNLDL
jgi:hypothetical protein